MSKLSFEDVKTNYASHPSFMSDETSWKIDQQLLRNFSKFYGENRTHLSSANFRKAKKVIFRIFEEFEKATTDKHELLFVQELKEKVIEFITDEFKYRNKISLFRGKAKTSGQLEEFGYFFITLPKSEIENIKLVGEPLIQMFRKNASEGKLKRSDLSDSNSPEIGQMAKMLDVLFERFGVFKSISEYVGIEYDHTGLSLELSVAGSTWWKDTINNFESPSTMYAHLDESVYLPKAIVYLSNVTEFNGPTSCYPNKYEELNVPLVADIVGRVVGQVGRNVDSPLNSYYEIPYHQPFGSGKFRKHFMKLPPEVRMNSHFGWDVIKGSIIDIEMASSEKVMVGGLGETIVFDGSRLLHRGGLIEQGERIVMQVVFYPRLSFKTKLKEKLKSMGS